MNGDRFDPSFRKADKVGFMKVDEIGQGCGVKRVKNGTNVEGAYCEILYEQQTIPRINHYTQKHVRVVLGHFFNFFTW